MSNKNREQKLIKNTFILAIGTFLPKAASFLTLPILTAYLSKEEYGTYDLITVLVSLLLPATTLQIQNAAFRFLIDNRNNEDNCKSIISNIVAFIVPVSIVTVIILYFLLPADNSLNKILIAIFLFDDILVNTFRQIARGLNKTIDYSISAVISAVGRLIFVALFVKLFQMGLVGALLALIGATTISLFSIAVRIKIWKYIDLSTVSRQIIKELLHYSWPMVPNSMSLWVMRVSDRFVVTMVMGVATNAVYSIANKIPSLLNLAQNTFTMAWQENASVASKDKDADTYYSKMFRIVFDFMAGSLGLIICATPFLFRILIKGNYDEAYYHLPLLFLAAFFYSMCSYLGGVYVAYKATKSVGITTMVAAAINFVINICLIGKIGLFAASGSTLISYLLLFIYRMKGVIKLVTINYDYKHILAVIILLSVECGLCFLRTNIMTAINCFLAIISFWYLNQQVITKIMIDIKKQYINQRIGD